LGVYAFLRYFVDIQNAVRYSHISKDDYFGRCWLPKRSNLMFNFNNRIIVALFALTFFVLQTSTFAQDTDTEQALDDFIHYSLIANVEFAEGYALTLLRDQISDEDFYLLVIETKERYNRFDRAIGWAMFIEELEPLVAKLEEKFELGRTSVIRNAERLNESIDLLNGTTRQRILAKDRLKEAGEYSVPPLLRELNTSDNARTRRNVQDMLTKIGRDAVLPLSVALPNLEDDSQILVARVLGEIGYTHAAPSLLSVASDNQESIGVRNAAAKALERIGVPENSNLSSLQTVAAMQFYDGKESVMPQSVSGMNIFWTWDPVAQLVAIDVSEDVFDDVMAMYFASEALGSDPDNTGAMSVFVGANLRRNRELAGRDDLVYGNLAYSPEFYATVFGPEIGQLILANALSDLDTPLALDAITALSRTAGADSLLSGVDQPLVAAMYYPDRGVQYEAALTLASTLPTDNFTGSYRVVPLLASAVRTSGEMFAIVIGEEAEARREITTFMEKNGWKVVGEGTNAESAIDATGVVPGIDLAVVIARTADHGKVVSSNLLSFPETTVTPILILASGAEAQILSNEFGVNDMVDTSDIDISENAKLGVIEDLLATASGGRLSIDEEVDFSNRSLAVLRDIALADTVLQVDDATGTLIDALDFSDVDSQKVIAQTLAMIDNPLAQRALIDAALDEGNTEQQIMFLDESAGSVRRWGNLSQDWQVELVVDLAENTTGFLADAAARLNGALNNPNTSVMMFLP
jgi:HEAT repeat protein